jgi:hypothetical protein
MSNTKYELNEWQVTRASLLELATEGCETAPVIKLGIDRETMEHIAAIEVSSGDDDLIVAIKPDSIEVAVDSDVPDRKGVYSISNENEHFFMAELINAVWTNGYEKMFEPMIRGEREAPKEEAK